MHFRQAYRSVMISMRLGSAQGLMYQMQPISSEIGGSGFCMILYHLVYHLTCINISIIISGIYIYIYKYICTYVYTDCQTLPKYP